MRGNRIDENKIRTSANILPVSFKYVNVLLGMRRNRVTKQRKDLGMKSKILITGAAGFVGSNIAWRFAEMNYDVTGVDNLSFGDLRNVPDGIEFVNCGFEDLTEEMLSGFDTLIHCATSNIIYAMDHPVETFKNNAVNTINLFKKFRGKIIYTSTASVYGNAMILPTNENAEIVAGNSYDISKRTAEMFLEERGIYTTIRLSNVYGYNQLPTNPYCGVIGKLVHAYVSGDVFKIYGRGLHTRDYTFIDDVVDAVVLAEYSRELNTEINIATGVETSVADLISLVSEEINVKIVSPRSIDKISRRCLDISKAKRKLGWQPKIDIKEGLALTIKWYDGYFKHLSDEILKTTRSFCN